MSFLWPASFALLGLIPLMIAGYWWLRRRRRRFAVRYSSLSLIRPALPAESRLRRRLPFALFLLALACLALACARPFTMTTVPAGRANIILAMDVSRSMRQSDIRPSRLAAAQDAALAFIERQQSSNQIGIVAFAGIAQLLQPPTNDTEALQAAIRSLTLGRGTAIGRGILEAIDTIAEVNQQVAHTGEILPETGAAPSGDGSYIPDIIVLLTDGVNTTGVEPIEAAQQAAARRVRVFTIGYGTEQGERSQGGYFFGGGFYRGLDESGLKQIADLTGGKYFAAKSAGELQKVFASLPTYLITRQETVEITVLFAALGALLAGAAFILAQLWHPLP